MIRHMALAGAFLAAASTGAWSQAASPYVGEIETFSFSFCPTGWLPTNGQLVPIGSYPVLYDIIGTKYGGDGVTTFALPATKTVQTVNKIKMTQCISYLGVVPSQG